MVCSTMRVLGLMSGTSLDGLDLALADFSFKDGKYNYELLKSDTVKYSGQWLNKLSNSRTLDGEALIQLNHEYGVYLGEQVNLFLEEDSVDLLASHGHTVFHQPEKGYTLQIGSLQAIAATTGIKTVGDFRSFDVAKGGQGAPLVPIGDQLLFPEFDYCLNLGGISNFSTEENNERIAEDLSPCNIVSNLLMKDLEKEFDEGGEHGRKGKINKSLLQKLNNWKFYTNDKTSLGIEDLELDYLPMFYNSELSVEDQLRTYYEHLGIVIGGKLKNGSCLVTGGGAKNSMLVECIQRYAKSEVVIPSEKTIDFKEAIIFGLLGWLRVNDQKNVLKSVTGASSDSIAGTVISPK